MIAWTKDRSGNLSLVLNGQQWYVASSDKAYEKVLEGLNNSLSADEMVEIVDRTTRITRTIERQQINETLRIEHGELFYTDEDGEDEKVEGLVVERLLAFADEGLPLKPLANFIAKLMENPSQQSIVELYDFLEHKSLPICEDGDFLAYKAVSSTYMDKWTGEKSNAVGTTVSMKRNKVDDNRDMGCSKGLHAGTLEYVQMYGNFIEDEEGNPQDNSDKCIIVKIDPRHVVSVPKDCSFQKLRTEQYQVVRDYEGEMQYHLATNEGEEYCDDEYSCCDDDPYHIAINHDYDDYEEF